MEKKPSAVKTKSFNKKLYVLTPQIKTKIQKKAHMLAELRQKYLFDQQLSGIITGIYHGGINLPRNLTNVPIIPFNILQIYITFLGLVSYAADPGSRFHRTNILVMFDKLFKAISIQNNCKITPSHYYNAMRSNQLLNKFEEFTSEETQQDYTQIIKECTEHNRDVCSIGHYAFGTPLNQILTFCEQTLFDKTEEENPMFDDFCGWFMHVCEITTGDTPIWFSATNVTVGDGETQMVTNGITFVYAPIPRLEDDDETTEQLSTPVQFTKTFPERRQNAKGSLNPRLEDALVYDLCSFEEIRKVQHMTDYYVMLILKLLIARDVRFSTPVQVNPQAPQAQRAFEKTSYSYNWIDYDDEGFVAQFKDKLNDMKIYQISSEDFSVLLHILWFISNGRTVEIDCIINFMKIMSTCIKIFKNDTDNKNKCVNNINRFINDYVEQCAKYYHINFLTIMNGCRPNADPVKHGKTVPTGIMTQECAEVFSKDPSVEHPMICAVNCNNPPPPLPHFKEILESLTPSPPHPLSILPSDPRTTPPLSPAIYVENNSTNNGTIVTAVTGAGRRLINFLKFIFTGQQDELSNSIIIPNAIPQSSKRPVVYYRQDEPGIKVLDLVDTSLKMSGVEPDDDDESSGMQVISGGKRKTYKRSRPYKRKTHKRRKYHNTKHRISNW